MELMKIVKNLEGKSDKDRRDIICRYLDTLGIRYEKQAYSSGMNIIAEFEKSLEVGVASHFDVVSGSPGANDNASAVAVTLEILRRYSQTPLKNIGIRGFFFDEEECGLKGSRAYVKNNSLENLLGVYNMELVGNGDKIAFWSDANLADGLLLKTIKKQAKYLNIKTKQFPYIRKILGLQNSGDHLSFNEAGISESFCITAITQKDIDTVKRILFNPLNWINPKKVDINRATAESEVFKHYHKSSDSSEYVNEKTMQMVSDLIYNSACSIDNKLASQIK
ncbi:MAG: M28 family peptidase [Nanoarchaeota archaeon]|nr:M28 family peptidase [Nanoarchaeota archaeon]